MNNLRDYTIVLEITPTRPLAHGEGTAGNVQLFRRLKTPVYRDGKWVEEEIPEVSGAAFKSALREEGAFDILRSCEIEAPTKSQIRFLMKGGKLSKGGGNNVNLGAMRKVAELAPIMSVMGAMDDSYSRPGKIRVSSIQPWCEETVSAGHAPRKVRALTVLVDGHELSGGGESVELYPGMEPIPLAMSTQVIERFAHDMMSSPKGRALLEGAGVAGELEDKAAALKARKSKGKVKGANKVSEAMPYSYEVISPGTPMWATIVLQDATEIEWGFLLSCLWMWISKGAYLGGGRREDWGRCRVRISGAIEHETPIGTMPVSPGTSVAIGSEDPDTIRRNTAVLAYRRHLSYNAKDIRSLVEGL